MKLPVIVICILLGLTAVFSQKLGRHTMEEWKTIIDTTWGEGLSTEKKLQIFDLYWDAVDQNYAGFVNLDVDWDALKNIYRPEVAAGVSRGRFAAIMNHMALALNEIHTHANDLVVRQDSLHSGTPLLAFINAYQPYSSGHFGAGLTPLADSSLLVYSVVDDHPLGLQRGDRILGYDGLPWKNLYRKFLQAELPITGPVYVTLGTSERSKTHIALMSAGLNWHLCDTIDIMKYGANDTLHFPTNILENQDMSLFCGEQLPVAGLPMIDLSGFLKKPLVSWGIVENTQIGYIYVSLWRDLEEPAFTDAVNSLLNDYQTTGLILDFRANPGGRADMANGGFSRLFNFDLKAIEYVERSDPANHFALRQVLSGFCTGANFRFHADSYLYDKPIAVLTGPLTFSHADVNTLRIKFHPMSRLFGKPTNTAFTCYEETFHNVIDPDLISDRINYPDWQAGYAPRNAYPVNDPNQYLLHTGIDVDEEVWLTQDDVAKGEDTVVKRALEWIQNLAYAHDVMVNKTIIEPGADAVQISAQVENPNNHQLSVLAYISNDASTIDSVYLSKNDNTWSAPWSIKEENVYHVSVKTVDPEAGTSRTIPNVTHFASAGPLVIDSISAVRRSNFYPERLTFDIYLKNKGATATVKNVRAVMDPDTSHPCFAGTDFSAYRTFGDIAAGESKAGTGFSIFMEEACHGDTILTIPFSLEISSGDHVFWQDESEMVTAIEVGKDSKPLSYELKQNYPNPFNPTTTISYDVKTFHGTSPQINLSIYNLLGQRVATLVDKKQPAGSYQVQWDATGFASGIYIYTLETSTGCKQSKKLVLLK